MKAERKKYLKDNFEMDCDCPGCRGEISNEIEPSIYYSIKQFIEEIELLVQRKKGGLISDDVTELFERASKIPDFAARICVFKVILEAYFNGKITFDYKTL